MLLRNLFFSLFACLLFLDLQAQTNYNKQRNFINANKVWAFPLEAGLDFNNGNRVGIKTAMNSGSRIPISDEGAASVCDPSTGALLFYSNGKTCWNAEHKAMPNGNQLLGNNLATAIQGAAIIPFINDDNKYYLFSLYGKLFYSIIDRTLDNGKGDIVPGLKNIALDTTALSEAMIAIPGNNCDVWLVVHDATQSEYKAYNISSSGINTTPVISKTANGVLSNTQGSLAVSPNRALIALNTYIFPPSGEGDVRLSKFDPNTGRVFDELQFGMFPGLVGTSVAFSPDNAKLYTYEFLSIVQYDISNFNADSIKASQYLVSTLSDLAYLRLYNDTIYCAIAGGDSFIRTINNPNGKALSCGYQSNTIPLFAGTVSSGTLPVEVVYPLPPDTISLLALDTVICSGYEEGIKLLPGIVNKEYNYIWNNSDSGTVLDVLSHGTYWVRYGNGCHTFIDTFRLGEGLEKPIITVDSDVLNTHRAYYSYQWVLDGRLIQGATQKSYKVAENGRYQVIVTSKNGCIDTSDVYNVTNVAISRINKSVDQILIYPNPVQHALLISSDLELKVMLKGLDGRPLLDIKNTNRIDMSGLSEGVYLLYVYDSSGFLLKVEKVVKKN